MIGCARVCVFGFFSECVFARSVSVIGYLEYVHDSRNLIVLSPSEERVHRRSSSPPPFLIAVTRQMPLDGPQLAEQGTVFNKNFFADFKVSKRWSAIGFRRHDF